MNRHNLGYKPRDSFNSIVGWIESDTRGRVLGLYGLRRTGKTVLLVQICERYIKAGYNVAYALVSSQTDFETFSSEMHQLVCAKGNMPYIIAIDKITYADWFIPWANELSDKYAFEPKIIITGDYSLALRAASNSTLYDRIDLISTTYISYKEFSRIMDDRDIMTYIRFGGVLSSSREVKQDGIYNYIQTAIVENLEGTFSVYRRSRKAWPELWKYIDEDGSLSSIVQQFIMSSGESVMLSDLRRGFKDRNLSSALSLVPDIKLSKYTVSVLSGVTANRIGVERKQYELGAEVLDELISLLLDIEAITLGRLRKLNGEGSSKETCEIVFNQPGLRYEQAIESIRSLNLSASELGISDDDRGKIIEKLIQDTEGRLLGQIIWLNVMNQAKRVKDCEAFQARYKDKEIDIILKRGQNLALIEVKRSSKVIPSQSKWLRDEEFTRMISGKFGNIVKRYVVYRGIGIRGEFMGYLEQRIEDTRIEVNILLKKVGKCAILRPTGFGKTTLMCDVARSYNKILYIYPSKAIRDSAERILAGKNITWLTYYSLGVKYKTIHNISNLLANNFDLVIFDEIHHMGASNVKATVSSMMGYLENKGIHILGGTATPVRMDEFDVVSEFFGDNITSFYGLDQLIEDGLIPRPYYVYASQGYEVIQDILKAKSSEVTKSKLFSAEVKEKVLVDLRTCEAQIAKMISAPRVIRESVTKASAGQIPSYMKFIVFFSNKSILAVKKHEVVEWFKKAFTGYTVNEPLVIHSDIIERENVEELPNLKETPNTIDIILCINMLNEGYHVDNITGCILLRPTRSKTVFTQQVGRCMRVGMKNRPIIIDLVENLDTEALYGKTYTIDKKRIRTPREQKYSLNLISLQHIEFVDKIADIRKVLRKIDIAIPSEIDAAVLEDRKKDMIAYQIYLDLKENKGFEGIRLWQVLQCLEKHSAELKKLGLELKDWDRFRRGVEGERSIESFDKILNMVSYREWSGWATVKNA